MKELQGMMYSDQHNAALFLRKTIIPFSNFVFNLKSRIWVDATVLTSTLSNNDQRQIAGKSLLGTTVEIAIFSAISSYLSSLLWDLGKLALGMDLEEEDEEAKTKIMLDTTLGNFATDFLSPAPPLDPFVKMGINNVIKQWQGDDFDPKKSIQLKQYKNDSFLGQFGQLAIPLQALGNNIDFADMALTETFTAEGFVGEDVEKELNDEQREVVRMAAIVYGLYTMGVLPTEAGRVAINIKKLAEYNADKVGKKSKGTKGSTAADIRAKIKKDIDKARGKE
jgi:hypothetical protein